jgi:LysR family spv operon transcriptional activator
MNILLSRQFRYFIKVMETRSLNRAAEELCITRSPLGKIISELEERMDMKLFIRKYNEMIPTMEALTLHRRIKPVYDILTAVESEFDKTQMGSVIDILFDVSIPATLFYHYTEMMKAEGLQVSTRRVDIVAESTASLIITPRTMFISYRNHMLSGDVVRAVMPSQGLYMNEPLSPDENNFIDSEVKSSLPLLCKKGCFPGENFVGYIQHLLKDDYPNLYFMESGDELISMMYQVAAGKGMLLLPECMTETLSIPGIRKRQVPNIKISLTAHYHKKMSTSASIKEILRIVAQ